MLIKIRDIDTNHFKTFTTIEEFIKFLKPICEQNKLELFYTKWGIKHELWTTLSTIPSKRWG